eukprot:PITA_05221
MAMKMKTLISTILLTVCLCMRMPISGADPYITTVWRGCGTSEYANGSAFQSNLNQVLESLMTNVYLGGFNTSSVVDDGQNSNSTIYGLVQCRGDLNSSDCQLCASTAKSRLVVGCQNTSGFIQLDGCFLRYDNHSFYGNYSDSGRQIVLCNTRTSSQSQQFSNTIKAMLLNIANEAAQSPKLFAADSTVAPYNSTEHIYSIAQCWRDLSSTDCGSCLNFALSQISRCQTGSIGSQFESMNCYLRSEVYAFFNTLPEPGRKRSKVLGITLAVVAATVGLIAAIGLCIWKFCSPGKFWQQISLTRGQEWEINLSSNIANPELIFKYSILKEATSNFKAENKLGEGGFGSVYKGILSDGREVAVKRLKIGSRQGDVEFFNEANLISRVQHRNLVKLIGCSIESSERLLVYEYLQNSSLDRIIFDKTKRHLLDWRARYEIIVGTARGLAYLHEESEIRIIHRDIKASNVLLDNKNRPKIADFGLAKLFAEDESHVSTRVAGTLGYMAPEYALRGQLTEKADVFSFGVLLLEIISGRKNHVAGEEMEFLIERAWRLYDTGNPLALMDPTLEGSYSSEEGIRVIKIGLLCTQTAAALRPSMSRVVSMLTSEGEYLPSPVRPAPIDLDYVAQPGKTLNTTTITSSSSTTLLDIHSAAVDFSSDMLGPR